MAMLTLKSALKRKQSVIDFGEDELAMIRTCVMDGQYLGSEVMVKAQKSLISLLALWNKSMDYRILEYIVQQLKS